MACRGNRCKPPRIFLLKLVWKFGDGRFWNRYFKSTLNCLYSSERRLYFFLKLTSVDTALREQSTDCNVHYKMCFTKHKALKTYWGSGCIAPRTL